MKIGGHGVRHHIRLLKLPLGLIGGIWALRLIIAAAESPAWLTRLISVTTATSVAILLAVLLIHAKNFGGYANVVVSATLLNTWAELLIVAAILFSVGTGMENIYTAPEYSFHGEDPGHMRHLYGHLTYGMALGAFFGSAFGCLLLFIFRRLLPTRTRDSSWDRREP